MRIRWSALAIQDLIDLRDFIAEHDPAAAASIARQLIEAVESLPQLSSRGRPGRLPETRELVVPGTPYFIPYRVRQDSIEIIAVIHDARQWPDGDDSH